MALSRFTTLACTTALMLCGAAAQAAAPRTSQAHPARADMQQLREIGAAAQAARTGDLTSPGGNTYERNAMARCEVFKTQQDRSDCQARLQGSPVSGSVEGGGVLREATTPVRQ